MSTDDDQTQPVRPGALDTPPPPAPAPPSDPAPGDPTPSADPTATRRGFRERLRAVRRADGSRAYSLGALIASALAGVIIGGLGVTVVHALGDDHRDGPGWDRRGPAMGRDLRDGGGGPRGPAYGGPGGVPGQVEPTTPPQEDDGSNS